MGDHDPIEDEESDDSEFERMWAAQQASLSAEQKAHEEQQAAFIREQFGGEPDDGEQPPPDDEEEDSEAERMWQALQKQHTAENEEFQALEALRLENEQKAADEPDDDGMYEGEMAIAFDNLEFDAKAIGAGQFGQIFKGEYLGADVAIKKCQMTAEDDKKYVEREVATLRAIRHPNVVTFMGVSQHSTGLYLVTEFVPQGDLAKHLTRNQKPISWNTRLTWARDIASAMAYLHELGIIHRDLKAENLLLTDNNRIKVCDLGFARSTKKLLRRMSIAGTALYMAPEVITGDEYDEKCDVFGFGVVLYELITRALPPKRGVQARFAFNDAQLRRNCPPDCPPRLIELMIKCVAFRPYSRPTFKEVLPILRDIQKDLPPEIKESEDQKKKELQKMEEAEKAIQAQMEKQIKENAALIAKLKAEEEASQKTIRETRVALIAAHPEVAKSTNSPRKSRAEVEEDIEKEVSSRLEAERKKMREQMQQELELEKQKMSKSYARDAIDQQLAASVAEASKRRAEEEKRGSGKKDKKDKKGILRTPRSARDAEKNPEPAGKARQSEGAVPVKKSKSATKWKGSGSWGPARARRAASVDSQKAAEDIPEAAEGEVSPKPSLPARKNSLSSVSRKNSVSKEDKKKIKQEKLAQKEKEKQEKKEREKAKKEQKKREKEEKKAKSSSKSQRGVRTRASTVSTPTASPPSPEEGRASAPLASKPALSSLGEDEEIDMKAQSQMPSLKLDVASTPQGGAGRSPRKIKRLSMVFTHNKGE